MLWLWLLRLPVIIQCLSLELRRRKARDKWYTKAVMLGPKAILGQADLFLWNLWFFQNNFWGFSGCKLYMHVYIYIGCEIVLGFFFWTGLVFFFGFLGWYHLPSVCNGLELEFVILHGICNTWACSPSILHGMFYMWACSPKYLQMRKLGIR